MSQLRPAQRRRLPQPQQSGPADDHHRSPASAEKPEHDCAFYSLFHIPQEEHSGVIASFYRLLNQDGLLLFSTGRSSWQGTEDFHGAQMFWSHPDCEVTRQLVVNAGFAVIMSEVQEHGGETHYWIIAKKAHNQSLQGTPETIGCPLSSTLATDNARMLLEKW